MSTSAIEWTDVVWNPTTGCDRVSPGCANCYALTYATRLKAMGQAKYQRDGGKASGPGFGLTLHPDTLGDPLRWRKPRRVFVNSMSDLFHENVPDEFIARVWTVMARSPRHTFQILTKRPERMPSVLRRLWLAQSFDGPVVKIMRAERRPDVHPYMPPLPNVWLGTSIENRRFVHRADLLRQTPAAVRFISAEPLIGPLLPLKPLTEDDADYPLEERWGDDYIGPALNLDGIDWLIAGGESGADHRPMKPEWVRDLRDACQASGTAFFFKQWGGHRPKSNGRLLDGRSWDEMPAGAPRDQPVVNPPKRGQQHG